MRCVFAVVVPHLPLCWLCVYTILLLLDRTPFEPSCTCTVLGADFREPEAVTVSHAGRAQSRQIYCRSAPYSTPDGTPADGVRKHTAPPFSKWRLKS